MSQNPAVTEIEQGKECNTFHYTLEALALCLGAGRSPDALSPQSVTALGLMPQWAAEAGMWGCNWAGGRGRES